MGNKMIKPIFELGLSDNVVYINKFVDDVLLIEDDITIVVENGINVSFLDKAINKNINIKSKKDSVVNYTILGSENTNRVFEINGELLINQISLVETSEKLNVKLLSSNASCDIKCLSLASNMKNVFEQYVDHLMPLTTSNISNVGVSINSSSITFNTTGKIQKGMNNSKCAQLSRGIVMDDTSSVVALPILLIDEFDCFANHGATIGKMSDDDLFYLMSRGLSKRDAFLLILQGIINPFISAIEIDELKEEIAKEVSNMIEM